MKEKNGSKHQNINSGYLCVDAARKHVSFQIFFNKHFYSNIVPVKECNKSL